MHTAEPDAAFVELWLGRQASPHTRRNYARQAAAFLRHVGKPLADVTLGDVIGYVASLEDRASATRANAVAIVKSLLSFAAQTGYLPVNVGAPVKAPSVKNTKERTRGRALKNEGIRDWGHGPRSRRQG